MAIPSKDPLKPKVDDKPLWDILLGLFAYPALLVAHKLKLFSILEDQPQTFEKIQKILNIAPRPAEAIIAANSAMGMLKLAEGRYQLTPLAQTYLLESSPTYFGGLLDGMIANDFHDLVSNLEKAVISDTAQVYDGKELFQTHQEDNENAQLFTKAMHSLSMASALTWPGHLDLSQYHHFLDIGGGSGAHTIGALRQWPQLTGTVLDLAPICEIAKDLFLKYDLQERANTVNGDFFKDPYPKADIHFYSQIFHDWPLDKCRFLTTKSFESMPSGGMLLLHEILYDDDKGGPLAAAASSIAMLTWTEGRQYSKKELTGLLTEAGFVDIKVVPSSGYWSILSGQKK